MTYPGEQPPTVPGQPNQYWPPQPAQPAYGPPPGYQPSPPTKPPNSKLVFWTSVPGIISIFAIAAAGVVGIVVVSDMIAGPAADNFKVAVTSCQATGSSSLTTATIGLTVTNTSKAVRSATVKIEYRDGGARIDTDTAHVRNIQPGDTARTEESTILDAAPVGTLSCEITGIS